MKVYTVYGATELIVTPRKHDLRAREALQYLSEVQKTIEANNDAKEEARRRQNWLDRWVEAIWSAVDAALEPFMPLPEELTPYGDSTVNTETVDFLI